MRLMALDVGDKTIGIALTDELGIIASPFKTLQRTVSPKADMREITAIIEEFAVSKVVVGIPKMMSGDEAIQAGKVREFADKLAKRLRVPLEYWDERLSTVEAERSLIEAGERREDRKAVIDSVAAAVILKGYLEGHRNVG